MLGALLERAAPHIPAEDQAIDGPDTRSFRERLYAADQTRSENPNILWSNWRSEAKPHWEIVTCFQWTHWVLGIDIQSEHVSPWCDGHLWICLGFGPWTLSIARTIPRGRRRP